MEMLGATGIPVIYADEVGTVEVIGGRARITLVEYRRIDGMIVKQPVAEIIRPLESLCQGMTQHLLQEAMAMAATAQKVLALGVH